MSTRPEAVEDDLAQARAVCRRLARRRSSPPTGAPPPADGGYVRFLMPTSEPPTGPPSPDVELPELPVGLELDGFGSAGWVRILAWCKRATDASGAFAVDGRGLTIAQLGDVGDVESIGPRLTFALEQVARMAPDQTSRSIVIALGEQSLTGIWLGAGADRAVTLCLVGPTAPTPQVRERIVTMLERKLDAESP